MCKLNINGQLFYLSTNMYLVYSKINCMFRSQERKRMKVLTFNIIYLSLFRKIYVYLSRKKAKGARKKAAMALR